MSINLLDHSVYQYSTDIALLLQERGSKLRGLVSTGNHHGRQASPVNQIGAIEAQTPAGRFAPKARVDAALARRWVLPVDKDISQLIDQFDVLRLNEEDAGLSAAYSENASLAMGRAMDDAIIDAALGASTTGEQGGSSEAFDTANQSILSDFGASADTGLTVAKLIECQRMFMVNNVDLDMDPATLIISPRQHANLLNQVEVVSTEFNERPVLVDGKLKQFMGFSIIISNRLDAVSTDTAVIAFVKSGMYLGIWSDIQATSSIRNDLSGEPVDLYTKATYAATRLEQGKVIRILCKTAA